ncbi:MAG TPA: helix-turn-helix domain-containing protein [Acidimicrobiales bacterium]|nr:helix-turn-helix domain-containing protein [Acidimicrobiales bacterium]
MAAARAVFLEQGFSGARTKDIAERSGVTEAFLYRHFDSKDQMYAEAILDPVRLGLEGLERDIRRIHAEQHDPVDFLQALNALCLSYYMEYAPLQAVALYSELGNGRDFYNQNLRPLIRKIGVLIADRVWRKDGLDPLVVGRVVLGAEWAVGLDYMMRHKKPDLDTAVKRMTQMFTGGIKEK